MAYVIPILRPLHTYGMEVRETFAELLRRYTTANAQADEWKASLDEQTNRADALDMAFQHSEVVRESLQREIASLQKSILLMENRSDDLNHAQKLAKELFEKERCDLTDRIKGLETKVSELLHQSHLKEVKITVFFVNF